MTWLVYGQDTNGGTVAIAASDKLGFFGTLWDAGISVGSYQDSTHVETSVPADKCTSYHLHNTKFLTTTTVSLDGAASAALTTLGDGDVPLKINFTDASSVETLDATIFAYNGSVEATGPTNITFQVVEAGATPWVAANGSGSANDNIADHTTPSTTHDFYFACSCAPGIAGELDGAFTIKFALYYQ